MTSLTKDVEGEEEDYCCRDRTHRHVKRYLLRKLVTLVVCCSDSSRTGRCCHPNSGGVQLGQVGLRDGLHLGGREAQNHEGAAEAGPVVEIDD